jgi:hypothetical protein
MFFRLKFEIYYYYYYYVLLLLLLLSLLLLILDWHSIVGVATYYGLDGSGIESRWEQSFPQTSRPAVGPCQSPIQWVPGLFQS